MIIIIIKQLERNKAYPKQNQGAPTHFHRHDQRQHQRLHIMLEREKEGYENSCMDFINDYSRSNYESAYLKKK